MSDFLLIPYDDTPYPEVFKDLSNKFIGFCYIRNTERLDYERLDYERLDYETYLNILCDFLNSYVVEQTIFENSGFISELKRKFEETYDDDGSKEENGPVSKKRRTNQKITGGKDNELTVDQAKKLVSEIEQLLSDAETILSFNQLDELLNEENLTQDEKNKYTMKRKELLNKFKEVLLRYDQMKKAGSIEGDLLFIPPIAVRRGRSSDNINTMQKFSEKMEVLMLDIHKIIKHSFSDEEKKERKRLKDMEAFMKGDLTSQDKKIRDNFIVFIAKSGLFLTGICNEQGVINTNYNLLQQNSTLRKQINILLYIANWTNNYGWNEVKTQDLDSVLLKFFETKYNPKDYNGYIITEDTEESKTRYVCRDVTGSPALNYVVNNAANVENGLKLKTFCPYSSILDGMSNCSWNTAQGYIEYGNIDFSITNVTENLYYNGKMIIDPNNENNKEKINLSFAVKLDDVLLNGNKSIIINGSDLEAHFVLKNTLLNIINYILILNDDDRNQVLVGGNIFEKLFLLFTNKKKDFNIVYSEILFKGTGDLFQEINCVSKFGGYTMTNYNVNAGILPYYKDTGGDQLRFFAANDRPSGTRFMFMLINGDKEEINLKAVGGYYSGNTSLLVKRDENKKICDPIIPYKTKGGKMKYRKTKKIINKKNMRRFTNKHKNK